MEGLQIISKSGSVTIPPSPWRGRSKVLDPVSGLYSLVINAFKVEDQYTKEYYVLNGLTEEEWHLASTIILYCNSLSINTIDFRRPLKPYLEELEETYEALVDPFKPKYDQARRKSELKWARLFAFGCLLLAFYYGPIKNSAAASAGFFLAGASFASTYYLNKEKYELEDRLTTAHRVIKSSRTSNK